MTKQTIHEGALVLACIFVPTIDDVLDSVFIGIDADRSLGSSTDADQALEAAQPVQLIHQAADQFPRRHRSGSGDALAGPEREIV